MHLKQCKGILHFRSNPAREKPIIEYLNYLELFVFCLFGTGADESFRIWICENHAAVWSTALSGICTNRITLCETFISAGHKALWLAPANGSVCRWLPKDRMTGEFLVNLSILSCHWKLNGSLYSSVSESIGRKMWKLHANDQDVSAGAPGGRGVANMSIMLSLKCSSDSSSAHKHELIPDGVNTVIQMYPDQSACDRITDFALEKSSPLWQRGFRKPHHFLSCHWALKNSF